MTRKTVIYSHEVNDQILLQIPAEIQQVLLKHGWNVFGVYEIVKKELAKEKRKKKASNSVEPS